MKEFDHKISKLSQFKITSFSNMGKMFLENYLLFYQTERYEKSQ